MITKLYVLKAVKKLKPDKVNDDGLLLSENVINGSDLLFVYVSLLFNVLLSHSLLHLILLYRVLYQYLKELE